MAITPDRIADAVLAEYDRLAAKRKPQRRDNGVREWVPLSGIVAEQGATLTCLCLATGMKCLPTTKIPLADGTGLHDSHAEVLAIRALNQLLLSECLRVAEHGSESSSLVRWRSLEEQTEDEDAWHRQPFALKDGTTLHMYCSEAPCGDASMELTMAAQKDAAPWEVPSIVRVDETSSSPASSDGPYGQPLPGRAYFSLLGVVRRKPARGDAPETLSKSCSDKLAQKQCTSLLSSVAALVLSPERLFLHSIVLPESQHSISACERSFAATGRMKALVGRQWPGGYSFRPFEVQSTSREFAFSKRTLQSIPGPIAASQSAVVWSCRGLEESLVGGVLQGRKPFDIRGASAISRRKMWDSAFDLSGWLETGHAEVQQAICCVYYGDVKKSRLLKARDAVKRDVREGALHGWVRNQGDDGFHLGTW